MISSLDREILRRLVAGEQLVAYHDVVNWSALQRQGLITVGFRHEGEPDRERLWCTITPAGRAALQQDIPPKRPS